MKKLLLVVIAFAVTGCATLGGGGYTPQSTEGWLYYLQGDRVSMLQADNLHMVERLMGMGRRSQLRRVSDDLVRRGDYVGLNTSKGFYPLAKCDKGQRIGRYATDVGIGALIGTIAGGKKGAAYGGGIGALVGVREDLKCWGVKNGNVKVIGLDESDEMPQQQVSSGRENGWNKILRQQRGENTPLAGSAGDGEFTLVNATSFSVEVYDGDEYLGRMKPDEERQVSDPVVRYRAYALIPNERGALSKDETDRFPSDSGWVFTEPKFGSERR